MEWLLVALGVLLIADKVLACRLPPPLRYISPKKRRVMRIALATFRVDSPESEAVWSGSWVYRADMQKCFVFVQAKSVFHPPSYVGYVVWHDRSEPDRLGGLQFHWGIRPIHAVQWYESRLTAAGGVWRPVSDEDSLELLKHIG